MDVYLTSYPLIRRDIGLLSKVPFRFAILDEAQYIKNAMSVGAGAVKQIKAQTRLALTGTPMENHPGELWSIFDFVLPGYLNSFAQFMHRFGTGEEADVLRSRIRPFLLRRLKGDVLRELPEKVDAPVAAGQLLGTLRYVAGNETIASVPISAAESVERVGAGELWVRLAAALCGRTNTQ